jgi:hypothetical protein
MSCTITDREIRVYLGHGQGNRRVRIKRDGTVEYYGSTNDIDRSHDYWHFGGMRSDIERQVLYYKERGRDRPQQG